MPPSFSSQPIANLPSDRASKAPLPPTPSDAIAPWRTFEDMLQGLHRDRIYIHPDQLAEFLLRHGLPVDLRHVPKHLHARANRINTHYQGDMARLEDVKGLPQMFPFE